MSKYLEIENNYLVVETFIKQEMKKLVDDRFYDDEKLKDLSNLEYIKGICKLIKFLHECKQILLERIIEVGFNKLTIGDNLYLTLSYLASSEMVGLYGLFKEKINENSFKEIYNSVQLDTNSKMIQLQLDKMLIDCNK